MSWKETDPVSLWKTATVVPKPSDDSLAKKTEDTRPLMGRRSKLWTSLEEMTPENQQLYMSKLISAWPYKWEKRAVNWPLSFLVTGSSLSGLFIVTKISADVLLHDPKARFLRNLTKINIMPAILCMYTTGIVSAMYHKTVIARAMESDEKPSLVQLGGSFMAVSWLSGIIMPLLVVPPSVHIVNMSRSPRTTKLSVMELVMVHFEYPRSVWRYLPALLGIHTVVGVIAAYTLLWGRSKIFETADMDPEFIRECIRRADLNGPSWFQRTKNWFTSIQSS